MYDLLTRRPTLLTRERILLNLTNSREKILDVLSKYIGILKENESFMFGDQVNEYKQVTTVLQQLLKMSVGKEKIAYPAFEGFTPVKYNDLLNRTKCSASPLCSEGFIVASEAYATPVSLLKQAVPVNHNQLDLWGQIYTLLITDGCFSSDADSLFMYGMKLLLHHHLEKRSEEENKKLVELLAGDSWTLQTTVLRLICEEQKVGLFMYDQNKGAVQEIVPSTAQDVVLFVAKYATGLRIMIPHTKETVLPIAKEFLPFQHVLQNRETVFNVQVNELSNLPLLLRKHSDMLFSGGYAQFVFGDFEFDTTPIHICRACGIDGLGWVQQTLHRLDGKIYMLQNELPLEWETVDEARTDMFPTGCIFGDELIEQQMKYSLITGQLMVILQYVASGFDDHGLIWRTIFTSSSNNIETRHVGKEGKTEPFIIACEGCSMNKLIAESSHECRIIIMEKGSGVRVFYIIPPCNYTEFREWGIQQFKQLNIPIKCENWIGHGSVFFEFGDEEKKKFPHQKVVLREGQMLVLAPGTISFGMNLGESVSQEFNMYMDIPEDQIIYQPLCTPHNDFKTNDVHFLTLKLDEKQDVDYEHMCLQLRREINPFKYLVELFNKTHQQLQPGVDHLQAIDVFHKLQSLLPFRKSERDRQ